MPWYCPTIKKVLERGEGDCKARALVLASVLEAKNIPYQVHSSPIHVWVDYEGKQRPQLRMLKSSFINTTPKQVRGGSKFLTLVQAS